jgi:hypothetical protein
MWPSVTRELKSKEETIDRQLGRVESLGLDKQHAQKTIDELSAELETQRIRLGSETARAELLSANLGKVQQELAATQVPCRCATGSPLLFELTVRVLTLAAL